MLSHQVERSRLPLFCYFCGIFGFPLWALSYGWVPFALIGRESGPIVTYIVVFGEAGGFLMGLLSVGSGLLARRHWQEPRERKLVSRGLTMGATVLGLIVGLNLLGLILWMVLG